MKRIMEHGQVHAAIRESLLAGGSYEEAAEVGVRTMWSTLEQKAGERGESVGMTRQHLAAVYGPAALERAEQIAHNIDREREAGVKAYNRAGVLAVMRESGVKGSLRAVEVNGVACHLVEGARFAEGEFAEVGFPASYLADRLRGAGYDARLGWDTDGTVRVAVHG